MACVKGLPRLPDGSPQKPSFILVILPPGGDDLRKEVKYWGDVQMGIATQCVVRRATSYVSQSAH